jgi:hypothetical protein
VAVPFPNAAAGQPAQYQDIGSIKALIKDDVPALWALGNAGTAAGQNAIQIAALQNLFPNSLVPEGLLFIPNRGVLKVLPGDWVGVDTFGWPILVSGRSIQTSAGSWTHTGNPT